MPRVKPKNQIQSRAQAEIAMTRLNSIDLQLATLDMAEAKAIGKIREIHAEKQQVAGRPLAEAEKALLLKELKIWAEGDSASWKDKSLELPLGRLGFRLSTPAVTLYKAVAKTMAAALDLLAERMPKYVRLSPSIDKDKILAADRDDTLDRDKLRRCGLRITQKNEFYSETVASIELQKAVKALKNA